MKALTLYLGFMILASTGYCQDYVATVQIPKVPKDGFYQIALTPEITSYFVPGLTNLRIADQSNQEIPYIIRKEVPVRQTEKFYEYEMEKHKTHVRTELILKNPERKAINNIHLKIRNADVTKEATLLGSDDHKSWFAIKEKFSLSPIDGGAGTFEMKVVGFPLSNYLFYSLQISDSLSAPINILSAGYYGARIENGNYAEIVGDATFTNDPLRKQSILNFYFDTIQFVDRIDLTMKSQQKYFLRRASLKEDSEVTLPKGKVAKRQITLAEFEVSSTHATHLDIENGRLKAFKIVINNEDNPPLQLSTIQAYQLNRYLITWLSANNDYVLKIGKENLPAPVYDLKYFLDSIPAQLETIPIGDVVSQKNQKPQAGFSIFTSRVFIWVAIAIVALLLGYMAIRLAKDIGKSTK